MPYTNVSAIRSLCILIAFCALPFSSNAQLSIGADLGSIFNFSEEPALMIKYRFADDRLAGRLAFSGSRSTNRNAQNFYEDDRYYNLDKWPESINKDPNESTSRNMSLTPGIEYRHALGNASRIYLAVECKIFSSGYEQANISHSSYLDANLNKYIIQQVYTYEYYSDNWGYAPGLQLGVDRDLGKNFSAYGEFGVNASISKQSSKNSFSRYIWNGNSFDEQPQPDAFKEQDIPWSTTFDWNPSFRLFLAYTLDFSKEEEQ